MALRNVYPWIKHAQQNGYAIGAFNANTLEQTQPLCWQPRPSKLR